MTFCHSMFKKQHSYQDDDEIMILIKIFLPKKTVFAPQVMRRKNDSRKISD